MFITLEGNPRHLGLVMLNKPDCVESNRAMFESLLLAYRNNWDVTVSFINARLKDILLNSTTAEDVQLESGLIYAVSFVR